MEVEINFRKSTRENMQKYYDEAKKAKHKREAALKAIENLKNRIICEKKEEKILLKAVKRDWFEKFKWFYTSRGKLVIAGRDATSNEIIIKKHTEKDDIVFHTEAPGSPFCVIKTNGEKVSEDELKETAQFCASHSAAWKRGLGTAEVYWIRPEQVSKEAPSGEYISKGAFMIDGKRNYMNPTLEMGLCVYNEKLMCGPLLAIEKLAKEYYKITLGNKEKGEIAKIVKKKFPSFELDDILRILPTGGIKIEGKVI